MDLDVNLSKPEPSVNNVIAADHNSETYVDNVGDEEILSSSSEMEDANLPGSPKKLDGRSYLQHMQSQQKWETCFPWAFYSANEQDWLCKVCSQFGNSDDIGSQQVLS